MALETLHRCNVDDGTLALLEEGALRYGLRQQEKASDVETDHLVPPGKRIVLRGSAPSRAGVVDEDVDPPELVDDTLGEARNLLGRAEIGGEAGSRAPCRNELFDGGI